MQLTSASKNTLLTPPKHFYLLDAIRGLAALAVVLWHWQHFYYNKTSMPGNFNPAWQPFYKGLYVFYTNGAYAVDFFFLLSGFIFFHLYARKIAERNISAREFSWLRFSRLYPLHLLTLLAVAAIQVFTFYRSGYFNVYAYNDAYHFILNLFFASSWGLEKGSSFNGPSWSVSVEVFLYALFFAVCRYRLNNRWVMGALVVAALLLTPVYSPLGRGIFSFFIGGAISYLYAGILLKGTIKRWFNVLLPLCFIFAVVIVADIYFMFIEKTGLRLLRPVLHHKTDEAIIHLVETLNHLLVKGIVFPCIMLLLVLYATLHSEAGKKLAFIGNISYSSYLLHFPLQLLLILLCRQMQWRIDVVASSSYTLVGFYVVLIAISMASFHYFELPVQKYLRGKIKKQVKVQPVA